MTTPGAVVIGGYANGVSALRSLAREGVRTAVVLTKPHDIAHHSRYAHEAHRVLDLHRRPDGLLDLLEDRAGEWRGWALIPTNDYALPLWRSTGSCSPGGIRFRFPNRRLSGKWW